MEIFTVIYVVLVLITTIAFVLNTKFPNDYYTLKKLRRKEILSMCTFGLSKLHWGTILDESSHASDKFSWRNNGGISFVVNCCVFVFKVFFWTIPHFIASVIVFIIMTKKMNRLLQKEQEYEESIRLKKEADAERRAAMRRDIERAAREEERRQKEEERKREKEQRQIEERRRSEEREKAEKQRKEEEQRCAEEREKAEKQRKEEERRQQEQAQKMKENLGVSAGINIIDSVHSGNWDVEKERQRQLAELERAENQRRLAEQQRLADQRRLAEQQRLADQRRLAEQQRLADQRRLAAANACSSGETQRMQNSPHQKEKIIRIGRSSTNDVCINDEKVSRSHLLLIRSSDGVVKVTDLGSTNGTYVNGNRIKSEFYLNPDDEVKIGSTVLPWKEYLAR